MHTGYPPPSGEALRPMTFDLSGDAKTFATLYSCAVKSPMPTRELVNPELPGLVAGSTPDNGKNNNKYQKIVTHEY